MKTLQDRIPHIESDLMPRLIEYTAIGWTAETEALLALVKPDIEAHGRDDLLSQVRAVEKWLAAAKEQEALRGRDCLFDISHPRIQRSIQRITAGGWKMVLREGARRPCFE